ncbi:hypothetical protein JW948_15815 [bacterium]|nr:hypothetical protein [bacterium]
MPHPVTRPVKFPIPAANRPPVSGRNAVAVQCPARSGFSGSHFHPPASFFSIRFFKNRFMAVLADANPGLPSRSRCA